MEKNQFRNRQVTNREWSTVSANFINGCKNDCKYCYAKRMAITYSRNSPENWKNEQVLIHRLENPPKAKGKYTMFPSSHDISMQNIEYSTQFLEGLLLDKNRKILIVTKPNLQVIKILCEKFESERHRLLFRFTIGSIDSEILKFWEPNAPSFEERFQALKYAHENGFQTSVSIEPALDDNTMQLVELLLPFVTDAVWIGRPTKLSYSLRVNGHIEDLAEGVKLTSTLDENWAMKLYEKYKNNPKVKWKGELKDLLGIPQNPELGMDL